MKVIGMAVLALMIVAACAHAHHYHCQFDSLYKDIKHDSSFHAKLDEPTIRKPSHGRQLITVPRQQMRISLDTTDFMTIKAGLNGTPSTTNSYLTFLRKAMSVVKTFLESRLKVASVSRVYAPSFCVDFNPPTNDVSNGIAGTDLHIYIRYITDQSQGYGATGKSCKYQGSNISMPILTGLPDVTLQQGRPTVGRIIFNTFRLVDTSIVLTNMLFQTITSTALHETMHILGFDSTLYPYYLNQFDGDVYGLTTVNGSSISSSRPATKLLTTPYVTSWAQSFFGCANLTGMTLENQDGVGFGSASHWERTAMYDQLMTGTSFGAHKGMSGLTFAILKDMGWYDVDDTFNETTNFGYKKGCNFFNDACYGTNFPDTFCDAASLVNTSRCQTNFYSKATCSNIAAMMSDGCGMYGPYFDCVNPSNSDDGYKAFTYQEYGAASFCVAATLSQIAISSTQQGRCYPYVCTANSIQFKVGVYSITCLASEAGNLKTLSALTGALTCPIYDDFCKNSRKTCPNWCSQNGFCMGGKCNCLAGFSGADCSATICTSTTTFFSSLTSTCVTVCPSKTYQDKYTQACIACATVCQQCRNQPGICTGCVSTLANPQVFYNTTSTCYSSCPASTYQSIDTCYDCDTNVSHCSTCSMNATNCTSCNSGLYLSTPSFGSCVANCTAGNYTLRDVVNFRCTFTCDQNLVLTNNTCDLCPNGTFKFISNQSCIGSCPNNYYSDAPTRLCQQCHSSCLNCDGMFAQNCTACNPTSALKYLLLKMCLSICPRGFYQNNLAGACEICTIGLNCATCNVINGTSSVICTTCSYGFYFLNSTCGSTCPSYYYRNAWNRSCDSCSVDCGNCNGPSSSSCIDCHPSYFFLTNISGRYCVNPCPTVKYVTSSTNCLSCDPTCLTCNGISSSNCVTCASGYYFHSGYCRFVCPAATYPNSTLQQCLECNNNCTFCFGSTINDCVSCVPGMVLYNFTCQSSCPGLLTVNQWNVCFGDFVRHPLLYLAVIWLVLFS